MKLIAGTLVCLLLAAMCLQSLDGKSLHVSSSNCCYKFAKGRISEKKIECYRSCSSSCSYKDGVIFKMKGGMDTCALKTEKWVQGYLNRVKPCM